MIATKTLALLLGLPIAAHTWSDTGPSQSEGPDPSKARAFVIECRKAMTTAPRGEFRMLRERSSADQLLTMAERVAYLDEISPPEERPADLGELAQSAVADWSPFSRRTSLDFIQGEAGEFAQLESNRDGELETIRWHSPSHKAVLLASASQTAPNAPRAFARAEITSSSGVELTGIDGEYKQVIDESLAFLVWSLRHPNCKVKLESDRLSVEFELPPVNDGAMRQPLWIGCPPSFPLIGGKVHGTLLRTRGEQPEHTGYFMSVRFFDLSGRLVRDNRTTGIGIQFPFVSRQELDFALGEDHPNRIETIHFTPLAANRMSFGDIREALVGSRVMDFRIEGESPSYTFENDILSVQDLAKLIGRQNHGGH